MRLLALVAVLVALPPVSLAHAQYKSGNELLSDCEAQGTPPYAYCAGYITAIADTTFWHDNRVFCLPEEVTVGQLVRVVVQHMNQYPAGLHMLASPQVEGALSTAFPCP